MLATIFSLGLGLGTGHAGAGKENGWTMGMSPEELLLREKLIEGNSSFALDLYDKLGPQGNLFFSPYSISSALAMTYAGARENTEKEMKEILHFQMTRADLHKTFKNLNWELQGKAEVPGGKLSIANALILTGGDVNKEFKEFLKDSYDAEISSGDLAAINNWVNKKTEGKIDKILEYLDPNSVCVILNAIYFKGAWETPFEKRNTRDNNFRVSTSEQVKVPFMYQKGKFKTMADKDFQAILIPYAWKAQSMVILLPQTIDGLAALEKQLTEQSLKGWLAKLDSQRGQSIDLYLPKFRLETRYDLVLPVKKMGMKAAFAPGEADFSGMGWPQGKLWISQIVHKAFVEVSEEGTEAAAATVVEMATKSALARDNPVFRADHPFFFIIRDNENGTILFMGRVANPKVK